MSSTTPPETIIDLILFEHSKVKALKEEFDKADYSPERRQTLCWELIRELSLHSAKEEMTLYPAMRQFMGDEFAEHCLQEHQQMKQAAAKLDAITVDDPNFMKIMEETIKVSMDHILEEETDCLPKFREAVGEEMLKELGLKYGSATSQAPTRPHPEAPNKPPENLKKNVELLSEDLKKDEARFGKEAHLLSTA